MDTTAWIFVAIVAAIFIAVGYGFQYSKKKQRADDFANLIFPITNFPTSFGYSYTTPKGARIFSVVPILTDSIFDTIDIGLVAQINRMPVGWIASRNVSEYTIKFINPDALNQDGSPALYVHYQGGSIQAAGTVIGTSPNQGSELFICLPHQGDNNWYFSDYLKNSVWYEAEHVSEFRNDTAEFLKWAITGDVHPHRP